MVRSVSIRLAFTLLIVCLGTGTHAGAKQITIVALGDSLTAGYGLDAGKAFPDQLQAALVARGHDVEVVNAGVSGDTTAAGLQRLDWSVPETADGVIVELGANDALRGIAPATTRANLEAILARLEARDQHVLLAGMLAPPNMGEHYGQAFNSIYEDLADRFEVVTYPFFLEGVAGQDHLNQGDGIHPTEEGIAIIVKNMLPTVEVFLAEIADRETRPGAGEGE